MATTTRIWADPPGLSLDKARRTESDGREILLVWGFVGQDKPGAFRAAFIPVVGRDRHYVPADNNGNPCAIGDVCALQELETDRNGKFTLRAELGWWKNVDGVLVLLLYRGTPGGGLNFPWTLRTTMARAGADDRQDGNDQEIYRILADRLQQASINALERGLVQYRIG